MIPCFAKSSTLVVIYGIIYNSLGESFSQRSQSETCNQNTLDSHFPDKNVV